MVVNGCCGMLGLGQLERQQGDLRHRFDGPADSEFGVCPDVLRSGWNRDSIGERHGRSRAPAAAALRDARGDADNRSQ
jgi:hypothetical protein